jgi:O-antigen ligase
MTNISTERLAFNFGHGAVPSQRAIDAALAAEAKPTFATSAYAEPRDWGYAGLVAFTAVLLLRPQDQIPGLASLHIAEICAVIGICPMLFHRFARQLPVFRVTPETVALVALGFVIVATAPFSIWPGGVFQVFVDYVKIVIVFVLMMNTLTTPKRLEQITWLILVCCGYIAARAVFDYARGVNLVEDGRVTGAVDGIFGNPNDLALNMVTFMPAAMMVALTARYSPLRRLTAAGIAALMLATIVFTKSRGGAVGLGVMLLAMIVLGRRIRPGFAAMALGAVLLATPFMPATFWDRMSTIFDEQGDALHYTGSRESRRILLEEGLNTFWDYPMTGVGAGQFKNYNPPGRKERWRETHNALIQVAAETGLFGVLAFGFLIVRGAMAAAATRRLLARPRKRDAPDPLRLVMSEVDRRTLYAYTAAMTAGLVGWFTCALFASVAYSWTFYYLLALIVAARELARARLTAARVMERGHGPNVSVPARAFSPQTATGIA